MKMLKWALFLAIAIGFASCSVNERIAVKQGGSGSVTMDMDMGQMLDMLQQFMSKEDMEKKGMVKMDTTINMKDVLASDTSLPADKKALLGTGTIHIKLDMDSKVFTTHMNFPYSSQENLQKLYSTMSDGSLGTSQLMKTLGSEEGGAGAGAGAGVPASPDINQFNGIFDFTCHDGLMSKKVNQEKWKALQNDPQMAQIKQVSQMGASMEVNYTTTIVLPRPVKKIDNALAKLSDDKKTVVMKFNLLSAFDHPEQFEYTIAY